MLSRAGLIILFSVDSIMTGRAGTSQLAHYAIALAPQLTLLVLGIGLLVGTIVLTAQADGAGRSSDCGPIWSTSLWIAAVLGSLAGVVLLWGEPICQWRSKKGPPRRCKKGPLGGCGLVPVVHGRAPRATRRALNRLTRRRAREGPVGPRGQAWAGWSVQLAVVV